MTFLKLHDFTFSNRFTESLPSDPVSENYRRQVENAAYSVVTPQKFPATSLIATSNELAKELGLDPAELNSDQFTQAFSGNQLLAGSKPYAMCYGGHQFGSWAGQLGDGRVINLGEILAPSGQHWTLQLKGAGPTPYSRTADGLAVLRSSIREFLCSEAMFHLGVPTTRALSLVGTGETVERDMFYDGNPKAEPGAVVCRVAPSFIRFGSFELPVSRNDIRLLKQLVNYTIINDFNYAEVSGVETYLKWFTEVCELTLAMVVEWMRVGFVHGVMNTDNMSILGLTIDYGPYGWLEDYDPNWTPNTTDAEGRRYRFEQQPQIALWNLVQLANAIYPLIESAEPLEEILSGFKQNYRLSWHQMMSTKLGLAEFKPATDEKLIEDLLTALQNTETDMTIFFRKLAELDAETSPNCDPATLISVITSAFYQEAISEQAKLQFSQWMKAYLLRLQEETSSNAERQGAMNKTNPLYVLRNYLAQLAIDKSEQGDHSLVHELYEVLKNPYTEQEGKAHLAEKRPEWARVRAGCSMLSCSS